MAVFLIVQATSISLPQIQNEATEGKSVAIKGKQILSNEIDANRRSLI